MKTSIKHLSDTRVIATVTLGKPELDDAELVALKKLSKKMKVPGFRQGHVPLEVAKKHIDPMALSEETMNNALSKAVAEAFLSKDIQVLERPEVEVKKFVPAQELEFTAECDVLPKITLGDYKKLSVKKTVATVTKKDVDEIIERMLKGYAEKNETKGPASLGDEVTLDFVGKIDDDAFEGGSANDYALELGGKSFIPGFEEALVGHAAGESFDIPLSFPKDYHAKTLAGKKTVFSVTIKKVQKITVPKLSDEFAAKAGPYTSSDELVADTKKQIAAQREREATDNYHDELVKALVVKSNVTVPAVLREDQLKSIEQDLTQNLAYQGMTIDQYYESRGYASRDEWLEKEGNEAADNRIKAGLVLAELSKVEKIEATADELAERINSFRAQYANNPDMAKRFDEPEVQREVANRLITEKTVERLATLNTPQ